MPRPQFTLRALLVAMTEIALLCGFFAALPRVPAVAGAVLGGAVIASLVMVLDLLGWRANPPCGRAATTQNSSPH